MGFVVNGLALLQGEHLIVLCPLCAHGVADFRRMAFVSAQGLYRLVAEMTSNQQVVTTKSLNLG